MPLTDPPTLSADDTMFFVYGQAKGASGFKNFTDLGTGTGEARETGSFAIDPTKRIGYIETPGALGASANTRTVRGLGFAELKPGVETLNPWEFTTFYGQDSTNAAKLNVKNLVTGVKRGAEWEFVFWVYQDGESAIASIGTTTTANLSGWYIKGQFALPPSYNWPSADSEMTVDFTFAPGVEATPLVNAA